MENLHLDVYESIGNFKPLSTIKEIYTEQFSKVFDIHKTRTSKNVNQSKYLEINTIEYLENLTESIFDDNIVTTSSHSTTFDEYLPIGNKKIINSYSIDDLFQTKKEASHDKHAKIMNSDCEDPGNSKDSEKKTMENFNERLEKYIRDFDRANPGMCSRGFITIGSPSTMNRPRLIKNSNYQPLEPIKHHFKEDCICMRSNAGLTLPNIKNSVALQRFKANSLKLLGVISKGDENLPDLIPIEDQSFSSRKTKMIDSQEEGYKRDNVEDTNLSTFKIESDEDVKFQQISPEIGQPIVDSNRCASKKFYPNLGHNPFTHFPEMDFLYSRNDNFFKSLSPYNNRKAQFINTETQLQDTRVKIGQTQNDSKNKSEMSLRPVDILNEQTDGMNEYCAEFDELRDISLIVSELMEKDLINSSVEINQVLNDTNRSTSELNMHYDEIDRTSDALNICNRGMIYDFSVSSRDIDDSSPSNGTKFFQNSSNGDPTEINAVDLSKRTLKVDTCNNLLLSEEQIQKILNIFSLPIEIDESSVVDSSIIFPSNICDNLQSTCLYFDEKKAVSELTAILLQTEVDLTVELEELGAYEDFEKPLLFNNQMTSDTNQTI